MVMESFWNLTVVGGSWWLHIFTQTHRTVHLNWINFIVCKLYINKTVTINGYETMQQCREEQFL